MSIGPLEIAVIIVLALVILGPKRLPQAGRSLGQAVRELKKATAAARADLGIDEVVADVKDLKQDLKTSVGLDEVASDVKDIKAGMTISLKDAEKPTTAAAVVGSAAVQQPAEPAAEPASPDEAPPVATTAQQVDSESTPEPPGAAIPHATTPSAATEPEAEPDATTETPEAEPAPAHESAPMVTVERSAESEAASETDIHTRSSDAGLASDTSVPAADAAFSDALPSPDTTDDAAGRAASLAPEPATPPNG